MVKAYKKNADLYDYNRQVNRGGAAFILRLMGIHLPDKTVFAFMALMSKRIHLSLTEAVPAVIGKQVICRRKSSILH